MLWNIFVVCVDARREIYRPIYTYHYDGWRRVILSKWWNSVERRGLVRASACFVDIGSINHSGEEGGKGILVNTHADGVVGPFKDVLDILLRLQPVHLVRVALFSAPFHLGTCANGLGVSGRWVTARRGTMWWGSDPVRIQYIPLNT